MSLDKEDITQRRSRLAAQIARQRGELSEAYRNLEKPIHYAEYGLRGFGFLRKNPWVFVAVPAVFKLAATLIGLKTKKNVKPAPIPKPPPRVEPHPKGWKKQVVTWSGHGWKLFQLYRRVRHYFP